MSDNHNDNQTKGGVYGPPANENGAANEHSVPRSGPLHTFSPDHEARTFEEQGAAGEGAGGETKVAVEDSINEDTITEDGINAVETATETSNGETDYSESISRNDFYAQTSPYGDIYAPDSEVDGETDGAETREDSTSAFSHASYHQESYHHAGYHDDTHHNETHDYEPHNYETQDHESYTNSEEKAAAMVRSAAIDPDISSVPELAPLEGGDWDGPPNNGHYSTDLEPWQPSPDPNAPLNDQEMDLFAHLGELRARLLACVYAVTIAMVGTWNFGPQLQAFFAKPIELAFNRRGLKWDAIVLGPMEGFMIYFQMTMAFALLIVMPIILYQLWRFIEPALTHHERRYTMVLVPFSVGLFFTGAGLGYAVSPMFFDFFLNFVPPGARPNFSYAESVLLLAKMLLVFGICFQVPVVTIFVNKIGLVSRNWLIEYWRHVVIAIFIMVAIITPTWDPLTLGVCAIPPCLLYVLSIWLVKWL